MKNLLLLFLMCMGIGSLIKAQEVTYSKDIAPIIYNNCTVCHRSGEVGPMSLTSYEEVRNWGAMIQYVTETNYMPPWKPDKHYSSFQDERGLTTEEIAMIKTWVDNGMPQGALSDEPPVPSFPEGSAIGEPDLVLSFSEAYLHKGNNRDQYQIFVLPTGLTEDKVVKAIELRPGNRKIVHHALFALDISGQAKVLDAQTPEYGYSGFGGYGVSVFENYNGYVPGAKPYLFSEGMGQRMLANSDLLIQMHYAPVPTDEIDSTTVNIFFADEEEQVDRFVNERIMLPFGRTIQNGPFIMLPESETKFHCKWDINDKVSLLGISPHMHLLGKDWEVYVLGPNGDTTNLISIPEWDFNWQGGYFYKRFIIIEPGSEVHAFATYDNTSNNPLNPNSPPKVVTWGEKTTDEMFYLPFFFLPYQEGDEFVVFQDDITTSTEEENLDFKSDQFLSLYPNPSREKLTTNFYLDASGNYEMNIFSLDGKLIKQPFSKSFFTKGTHQYIVPVDDLGAGTYILQLNNAQVSITQKFTVVD